MWLIKKMEQTEATEIADLWKYPEPYSFYNMTEDIEDYNEITTPEKRKNCYFSIKDRELLIGFFSVEPNNDSIIIGLGMKPELTGKGKGKEFLEIIIDFVKENYNIRKIELSVADFNKRAIKLYKNCGFIIVGESKLPTNGDIYNFIHLEREI